MTFGVLADSNSPDYGLGIVSSSVTPEMIATSLSNRTTTVFKDSIQLGTQVIPYIQRGVFVKKDLLKDKGFYTQLNRKNKKGEELYWQLARIGDNHKNEKFGWNCTEGLDGYKDTQDYISYSKYREIDSVKIDNFNDYALVDGFDYMRPSNGKPYTEYRLGLPYEELAPLIKKAKAKADAVTEARLKKEQEEADRRLSEIKLGMLFDVFKQAYNYKVVRVSSDEIVVKRNNTYYYFEKGIFGLMLLAQIVNY